jgi:DNA-nicking Smr family endonuclease
MGRKRKKQCRRPKKGDSKLRPEAFNPALKERVPLRRSPVEPEPPPVAPPDPKPEALPEDADCFLQAMSDVQPLNGPRKTVTRAPDINMRPSHPAPDEDLEAMAHLSDLVSGAAHLDITFSDEYIEGCVHGVSRKLMQRLRRGKFPVQDHVDLHGLTKREAEERVREFLLQCHRTGLRCVLIVHGRGRNSENHIPVLKEHLPLWLTRGPARKIILAFSTARPYDGGSGAIYILLKSKKGGGSLRVGPVL